MLIINCNEVICEWNDELSLLSGIPRNEIIGQHISHLFEIVHIIKSNLKSETYITEAISHIIQTGHHPLIPNNQNIEREFIDVKGVKRYLQIKIFVIPQAEKYEIGAIVRDISHLKTRENQILEGTRKIRAIFGNTIQAFIIVDENCKITSFNKEAWKTIKHYFDTSIYMGFNIMTLLAPPTHAYVSDLFKRVNKGEKIDFIEHLNTHDGRKIWFEINLSILKGKNDKNYGIFISAIDISRIKRAEEEMKEALMKEQDLNKMKSQFISTVSHEFRTPLASIYSNAQLLQRYDNKWNTEKKGKSIVRILDSVKIMSGMLEDVSLIGKGLGGLQRYEPQLFNIASFFETVINECISLSNCKPRIKFENTFKQTQIIGDKRLLRHILENLINNAIKYSKSDIYVYIKLSTPSPGNMLLEVKDKGIGISDEAIKHIFEPFYRCEGVEQISGTGLGLAIVKQCVDTYGGTIGVESKPNIGSSFFVSLPYQ
jgi:PAS domain S-box-containing protein